MNVTVCFSYCVFFAGGGGGGGGDGGGGGMVVIVRGVFPVFIPQPECKLTLCQISLKKIFFIERKDMLQPTTWRVLTCSISISSHNCVLQFEVTVTLEGRNRKPGG